LQPQLKETSLKKGVDSIEDNTLDNDNRHLYNYDFKSEKFIKMEPVVESEHDVSFQETSLKANKDEYNTDTEINEDDDNTDTEVNKDEDNTDSEMNEDNDSTDSKMKGTSTVAIPEAEVKDNNITKKKRTGLKVTLHVGRLLNGPDSLKYAFVAASGKEIIGHASEMVDIDTDAKPQVKRCMLCKNNKKITRNGVDKHLLSHLIKKCLACSFTTDSLWKLQSHMLDHTLQCSVCKESFRKKEDLTLHEVLHERKLVCKVGCCILIFQHF